uniref:Uncharacterized protein n=1 Tax=Anguilla anguilla TaxID=7936 RepID=A0A0E9TY57_ANGAN
MMYCAARVLAAMLSAAVGILAVGHYSPTVSHLAKYNGCLA